MKNAVKRILIADDEEDLAWSLGKSLKKQYHDFEIHSVNSGNAALAMIKKFPLDLVISDVQMPGMSGLLILDYVKKTMPDSRVIIMSSLTNGELKKIADTKSGIYYLEKPFDMEEFKRIVNEAIVNKKNLSNKQIVNVSMRDLIKRSYQDRYTGVVKIWNREEKGKIHFCNGEIIHAKLGMIKGEMALINILIWDKFDYEPELTILPKKKTIYYGWKLILKDELSDLRNVSQL